VLRGVGGYEISYVSWRSGYVYRVNAVVYTEWPKKMYTLFTHQYLWNKFKLNFYFRVRV